MSSQLSAHAITAQTAMTRISVSRCSTLPAHRGSARAEKCSTSFATDIAILPSLIKGEPAQPVSPSEPARPFHALPLGNIYKAFCPGNPWNLLAYRPRGRGQQNRQALFNPAVVPDPRAWLTDKLGELAHFEIVELAQP